MKLLRAAGYSTQPWKNGGGTTRVIAAEPPGAGYSDALLWQVSLPRIETDGPFSPLTGLDRQWLMVDGAGVTLESEHFTTTVTRPLEPIAFSGDWPVRARLANGPVTALSVLTRHGRAGAKLRVEEIRSATPVHAGANETILVLAASGALKALGGGASATLERYDALCLAPREAATLTSSGWSPEKMILIHLW